MENQITPENNEVRQDESAKEVISQYELEAKIQQLKLEQNLPLGIIAGGIAALIGALLWAVITVLTNYQIGYMAIAVGFFVGYAVRIAGKGIDKIYGVVGAILAFIGCLVGNFFSAVGFLANYVGAGYFEMLSAIDSGIAIELMKETFSFMDLLFYAIAIYEGYRFSFRKIS